MIDKVCLVVDDEPSIRTFLEGILKTAGFKTIEADNAPQAFKLATKLNGSLDLVITDFSMPGDMSGLDLAYAIRTTFPATPVIVISGTEFAAGIQSTEFQFLHKPFRADAILAAIRKAAESTRI